MAYPPELEALIPLDGVFLNQKIEGWGVFRGLHPQNRYAVLDSKGQPLYAVEEIFVPGISRICLGIQRDFEMPFFDINGREVMRIKKSYQLFKSEIEVFCGNQKLGSVKRHMWACLPKFSVYDGLDELILTIVMPRIKLSLNTEFQIRALDGQEIGEIKKKFPGWTRDLFVGADRFGVQFPIDLHVNVKALLMAATILVDFSFFEKK